MIDTASRKPTGEHFGIRQASSCNYKRKRRWQRDIYFAVCSGFNLLLALLEKDRALGKASINRICGDFSDSYAVDD